MVRDRKKALPPPEEFFIQHARNREEAAKARLAPPPPEEEAVAEPEPKTYTVTGDHAVYGVQPGETVELALPESQTRALIDAGHLTEGAETTHQHQETTQEGTEDVVELPPAPSWDEDGWEEG